MSRTELFEDSDAHGGIGTYTVIVIRSRRKVEIKPFVKIKFKIYINLPEG